MWKTPPQTHRTSSVCNYLNYQMHHQENLYSVLSLKQYSMTNQARLFLYLNGFIWQLCLLYWPGQSNSIN